VPTTTPARVETRWHRFGVLSALLVVLAVLAGMQGCGAAPQVTNEADAATDAAAPPDTNSAPDVATPQGCVNDPTACEGKCGLLVTACGMIVDCGGCSLGTVCGGGGPNVCGTGVCTSYCGTAGSCGKSDGCASVCFGVRGKCPTGQICSTTTNACECDPNTCNGCCATDGTCDTACACGGQGKACCTGSKNTPCQAPLTCGGGQGATASTCGCTPSCATATCGQDDGCGGFCLAGSCPSTGQTCDQGVCVCNATSCPMGCCSGDQCEPGTSSAACGGPGGATCSACGSGSCVDSKCVEDDDSDGGSDGGVQDSGLAAPDGSMDAGLPDSSMSMDSTLGDSSLGDTAPADTNERDTFVPTDIGHEDTNPEDTSAAPDSAPMDSTVQDTFVPLDTNPQDTFVPQDTFMLLDTNPQDTFVPTDTLQVLDSLSPQDTGAPSEASSPDGGACFPAGMPVVMADGTSKGIDAVRAGEIVLSFNPSSHLVVPGRVMGTRTHAPEAAPELVLVNESLLTTIDHPFYVDGTRIRADALGVGTRLLHMSEKATLEERAVMSLRRVPGHVATFELIVDGSGIYLVDSLMVFGKMPGDAGSAQQNN